MAHLKITKIKKHQPLGPAICPGCFKILDKVCWKKSLLRHLARRTQTSKRVADNQGRQLAKAPGLFGRLLLHMEDNLGGVPVI